MSTRHGTPHDPSAVRRAPARAGRLAPSLLVGLALALTGCGPRPSPIRTTTFPAMGTSVSITLSGVNDGLARQAFAAAKQDFDYIQTAFNPHRPGPMGRTNELLAMEGWFSANPSVLPLIVHTKALYRSSHGLFNPAIGRLIDLWGFGGDNRPRKGPPPRAAVVRLLAARPSMDDIQVEGIRVRSTNPAVKLDMSGFTKGYAVEQVSAQLRSLGVHNALVKVGGDAQAIGSRDGHPWQVAIHPPPGRGTLATLELNAGESVFTSGIGARTYTYQGRRYRDIIDPRTGYPAQGTTSATVLCKDAGTAAAAARALLIAGANEWYRIARSMGIKDAMLVAAGGTVYMNPAMARRVHFKRPPAKVVMSKPL